jgi:hypothetical protein
MSNLGAKGFNQKIEMRRQDTDQTLGGVVGEII